MANLNFIWLDLGEFIETDLWKLLSLDDFTFVYSYLPLKIFEWSLYQNWSSNQFFSFKLNWRDVFSNYPFLIRSYRFSNIKPQIEWHNCQLLTQILPNFASGDH